MKILLLAYKFPPYAGVGGFRWSKLCKYLARLGVQCHVLTVHWPYMGPNTLTEDVDHDNIIIHRLRSGSLLGLRHGTISSPRLRSFRNHLFRNIIDPVWFWDDEAQRWSHYALYYAQNLIEKENIKTLVATGHPFQVNRLAAMLSSVNPSLRLIQDFRDPWSQQRVFSSARRHRQVVAWETQALEAADVNVFVTPGLRELFCRRDGRQGQSQVITNGFDPDDIRKIVRDDVREFDFVYTGNVGNRRHEPCLAFLNAMQKVCPKARMLFVGEMSRAVASAIRRFPQGEVRESINQLEALQLVAKSKIALQLNAPHVPFAYSTKIFEYAALGVPVLSINYGGDIDTLIRGNQWGASLNPHNADFLESLATVMSHEPLSPGTAAKFGYPRLAEEYVKLFH